MPPEAMIVRSSKLRSMTGNMTGWPHFLQSSVAKGGKSPEMNVLDWQRPQVTILSGLLAAGLASLTEDNLPRIATRTSLETPPWPLPHWNHRQTDATQLERAERTEAIDLPATASPLD